MRVAIGMHGVRHLARHLGARPVVQGVALGDQNA
jgi:hypothetical protein